MKKTYLQPTMRFVELHTRTTMLTISQFPDKAGINDEEGSDSDYD